MALASCLFFPLKFHFEMLKEFLWHYQLAFHSFSNFVFFYRWFASCVGIEPDIIDNRERRHHCSLKTRKYFQKQRQKCHSRYSILITSAECTNCFWHFFPKLFSPGLFAEAMKLFLMAIIYGCFCCVTANRCRPYLVTPVEDYNNYINAVFLNVSFSRAPAYRFWHWRAFDLAAAML